MVTINVWDKSLVNKVEKAIRESGLGINPVRPTARSSCLPIPELNEERRRELTKVAGNTPSMRASRSATCAATAWTRSRKPSRTAMSEDDQKLWEEVQEMTDSYIARRSTRRWRPSSRKSCRSDATPPRVGRGTGRSRSPWGRMVYTETRYAEQGLQNGQVVPRTSPSSWMATADGRQSRRACRGSTGTRQGRGACARSCARAPTSGSLPDDLRLLDGKLEAHAGPRWPG